MMHGAVDELVEKVGAGSGADGGLLELVGAVRGAEGGMVELVGAGGGKCQISKLLLAAVSPLVHGLLKDQGFCSGCPTKATILLPWADDDILRELIDELKLSTDCFDGLILASNTVRLQELARHLGIKIRAKGYQRMVRPLKRFTGAKEKRNAWRCSTCGYTTARTKRDIGSLKEGNHAEKDAGYFCPCNNGQQSGPFKRYQNLESHIVNAISLNQEDQNLQNLTTTNGSADNTSKSADIKAKNKKEAWVLGAGKAIRTSSSDSKIAQNHMKSPSGDLKRKLGFDDENVDSNFQPLVKIQRLDFREYKSVGEKTYLVKNKEKTEPNSIKYKRTGQIDNEMLDKKTRQKNKDLTWLLEEVKDEDGKRRMPYECYLCQSRFPIRNKLYLHFSCSHFRQKLLAICKSSTDACHLCGLKFAKKDMYYKIRHMGVTHGLVDQFVDSQHGIAKKEPRKNKAENNRMQVKGTDQHLPEKMHKCDLCEAAFSTERYLYSHYANQHYGRKVDSAFGEFYGTGQACPICKKPIHGDRYKWRTHLGVTHRLVFDYLKKEPRLKRQALKKGAAVKKEQAAKKWGKSGSASGGNNKGPESQQKCSKLCKTLTESSISDRLPRLEIDHEDNKNDVLKYAETLVDNKSFTKAPAVIIKQEDTVREAQMAHVLAKKIKQEAQDSEPDDFSSHCETSIDITDNMEAFGDTIPCDDINTGFSNNQKQLSTPIFNTETAPTSFSVTDAQPISQAAKDKGCTSGVENLSIVNARSDSTPANEDYQFWDDSPPDSPEIATANTFYIC